VGLSANRSGWRTNLAKSEPAPSGLRQATRTTLEPNRSAETERGSDERIGRLRAARAAISTTARSHRNNFLRLLGAALMIYGAVGLAASLYGYSLVRQAFSSARDIGVIGPDEKGRAVRGLQSISATLDDASRTSSNLTSSFKESQTSLKTASDVASDVATSFRQVAQLASVQVFGVQPMAGMAQPFVDSSNRLDALSQDLTRTSAAVAANVTDMQSLSGDFRRLKLDVDGLSQTVARIPTDPTADDGARRLETALSAMLVWIGLQGVAAFFAGLAILLLPIARRT
jgi:hypothetical protein